MKNVAILAFFLTIFNFLVVRESGAQCNVYPVEEAIINGDFETPVANPPTEFQLDGFWPQTIMQNQANPANIGGSCYYSTLNAYWVGSTADSFYCESVKKYGFGFCPNCFAITGDHTPGLAGKGHFLAVDTWSDDGGPGTRISPVGTQPIVWQQTVNVYPGQTYFFSAWAANWGPTPYAQLRFFVQGNNDATPTELGATPFTVPSSTWTQFFQTWSSNLNTSATITIKNQTSNVVFGNDFGLDDISFINSCQNTSNAPYAPNLGPDISLCYTQGTYTLNSNTPTNPPSRGFTWYQGTTSPQTVISPLSTTQNTLNINAPGTYRVCVFESGQCAVSSTITVTKDMMVNIGPNRNLCNPPTATFNTGYATPDPTISYVWRRNGTPVSSGINLPSYTATSAGTYEVTLTSSVSGCGPVSDDAVVTSNQPVPGGPFTYCSGVNFNMSVTGSGTYRWYDAAAGGNQIGTGTSITHNVVGTGTRTFYVEDVTATPLANTSYATAGTQFGSGHNSMRFSTTTGVQIVSVKARSQAWQGSCAAAGTAASVTIRVLQNGTPVTGLSTTYNFTCDGTHTIPLGFNIPAGSNYTLEYTNDGYFAWLPDPDYAAPSTIDFRPNASITITSDQTGFHGGAFYDWIINQVPGCARVPVTVTEDCPVPITLIDFTGIKSEKGNLLSWSTSTEINNDYFELQRSTDGINFTTIAIVDGHGTTNILHEYFYTDPYTVSAYYRLKQVDYDQNYSFSNVIHLKNELTVAHLSVYPVPVKDQLIVKIYFSKNDESVLELYNNLGQQVLTKNIHGSEGMNETTFDATILAPGMYYLKVSGQHQAVKFLKE